MKTKKLFMVLAAASAAWVPAIPSAHADDKNNFYVVGSIGHSNISADVTSIDALNLRNGFMASASTVNTNDTGYKGQLGYRFGNFAIEGGYTDLGRSSFTSLTDLGTFTGNFRAKLINLDLVGYIPLSTNFSLLGRLGGYNWQSESNVPMPSGTTSEIDDRGWNVKFGAGMQYDFNDYFGLRADFERYNGVGNSNTVGDPKVNLYSAGAVLKF
ncbi:MAG TPA: outer membrane beta-barrel protein [Burkholderiales bacterium]|nr:outer membrane beta-barrel protein [Burkholderiales bacterium]